MTGARRVDAQREARAERGQPVEVGEPRRRGGRGRRRRWGQARGHCRAATRGRLRRGPLATLVAMEAYRARRPRVAGRHPAAALVRAWDRGDEVIADAPAASAATARRGDARGARGGRDRRSTRRRPASHRHGDLEHASDHAHPHAHSGPGERPVVGIVGAGAVGTALGRRARARGLARRRRGVAGPGATRAVPRALVSGARAFAEPTAARRRRGARHPRRPRRRRRAARRRRSGCTAARRSSTPAALLGAEVLAPALAAGQPGRARSTRWWRSRTSTARSRRSRARRSRSRATTSSPRTSPRWPRRSARCRSGSPRARRRPTTPPRCWRPAAFVALLDVIRELAAATGLDEAGALRDLRAAASSRRWPTPARSGSRAALTGPSTRGDAGTVAAHLAALAAHAPDAVARLPRRRASRDRPRRGPWRAGTGSRRTTCATALATRL